MSADDIRKQKPRLFFRMRNHCSNPIQFDDFTKNLENFNEANLKNELYVCKRKLVSKCEALGILCRELDKLKDERENFKQLAQQAQKRSQIMRRALGFTDMLSEEMKPIFQDTDQQIISKLLFECIEHNKALQEELGEVKLHVLDLEGDIKLMRTENQKLKSGNYSEITVTNTVTVELETVIREVEEWRCKHDQLERDLRNLLDEKEELVLEREQLKHKYDRLNAEMNYILKGDEGKVVDIDALVMENKYLQDKIHQMEEEKSLAFQAISKYKNLLDRRKSTIYSASSSTLNVSKSDSKQQAKSTSAIITQKQVNDMLTSVAPSVHTMQDLQNLSRALLDSVHDKNLALTHQRKANKLLAERVSELERQVSVMEGSAYWRTACTVLTKVRSHDDVRFLFPDRVGAESRFSSIEDELDHWPCKDESTDNNT